MESELLQNLEDVGYDGPALTPEKLSDALDKGPKSVDFSSLVAWLADQLVLFGELDERVHATTSPEDASSFLLELSLFLKELGCVNSRLMGGNVNQRLSTKEDRVILLEYLITELMTSKILESSKPKTANQLELTINESETAKCLKYMLITLKTPKPPNNISADMLFKKLDSKLKEIISTAPDKLVGKALFAGELSPAQWEKLDKLQEDMNVEYKMRRDMLLKRLDVTVQSFLWSDRIKAKEDQLNSLYHEKRNVMSNEPNVTIAHLLAAREDLAVIEKTSNASVRRNTRSGINNVIIGVVPDRGGRPQDQEPPPPEMPSWQKDRVSDGSSFRGGRGGRGGGGGGSGGGGYRDHKDASKNFGQNRDNNYQNQQNSSGFTNQGNHGGYYQDNRGGEYQRGGRGGGGGNTRGRGGRVQGGWNQRGRGGQHY
ncbi:protein FAM98A [Venturia canescens]|uniref:protein FAM98A n=1 Tax=Venturia canescens TaxID=32260 RepID=UPI001C9CC23F|nr:protein FAM98A [Venturia canescens]